MKNNITPFASLAFLLVLIFSLGFKPEKEIIKHTIQVLHPGIDENEPVETVLFEKLDGKGETLEFFVNVESVICTDSVCKVVPVSIFWDKTGVYTHIELQKDNYLEKYEGEEFTKEDYQKLDKILKDRNSVLANYKIDEITVDHGTTEKGESLNELDGISGATTSSISATETIEGATLTCYTLWHWVNGDIQEIIKSFSPKEMETMKLLKPDFEKEVTLMEALQNRQSTRSFADTPIGRQDLSNLLWAAAGVNRSNGGKTVPLLGDIAIYVAMESGVYLYKAKTHELEQVLSRDIRNEISSQNPVKKAPLVFIMTIDDASFAPFMKEAMEDAHGMDFYYGNQVAYSTQNIYLYACSNDMNSVVIGGFHREKVDKMLGLNSGHHSYLIQLVGHKPE